MELKPYIKAITKPTGICAVAFTLITFILILMNGTIEYTEPNHSWLLFEIGLFSMALLGQIYDILS